MAVFTDPVLTCSDIHPRDCWGVSHTLMKRTPITPHTMRCLGGVFLGPPGQCFF